jgi:vitamin B12 transporter
MFVFPFRAGKLFPVCMLIFFTFSPLFPADTTEEASTSESEFDYSDEELFFDEDEGITVVAVPQTSQQMTVIEKETIEKHNAADLAVLLQETLNLGLTRYGGRGNMANINLRGFDSKRVALLVDGIPVNSAMDGKIDIDQIDLNSVERIEVIYGGSDSKYNVSGALGGVINIITVKKQKPGLRLGGSVSNTAAMPGEYRDRNGEKQEPHWEDLLDTQNYSLSAAYGENAFSVTANAFANSAANHFIFKDYIGKIRRKDNNEVWDTGADASVVWEFPSLTKLIASSNFYYGDKNIPSSGFSSNFGKQRDTATRHSVMLDMPRAFHDNLSAEASVVYSFANRIYATPAGTPSQSDESRHDQNNVMAINRWNWYPGQSLTVRSGIDYRFIGLDSTEIGKRGRHDGGVYLAAEYKPVKQLLIIPSIKAVAVTGGGGGITPVPKLGLLWNVNESISIKNNYFRSFKFPDFEELYWTGGGGYGNPDLRPEDGWGADIGAEWRFGELFNIENVFFTQWTRDSIHWYSGNGGVWRPENVGEAMFFGTDNKLRFTIPVSLGPVKTIIPSVSYQYLLSYLLSYGYDFSSEKRIPYMPAHIIGAALEIPWESGGIIISAHYESLRYTDRANITVLDPHFLLNMTINQKTGKYITVFASLRNMLNESYESFQDYPMPGFTASLGVRTQLEVN